jgi:hypothetical protein
MSIQERTEPYRVLICDGCGITCGEEPEAEGILRIFDESISPWDCDYPNDLGWTHDPFDHQPDGDYCSRCWTYDDEFDDYTLTLAVPGWWKS